MKKFTTHELDYIYSVLSEKLDKCICDGFVGFEDKIAELHLCLAKLAILMKEKTFN